MASDGRARGNKPRAKRKRGVERRTIPDPATVVAEATLVSPKGNLYRVIRTTQRDPYDKTDTAPAPVSRGQGKKAEPQPRSRKGRGK